MSTIVERIEAEFDEPIRDVLQGFADMGYALCTVAGVLEISPDTLKRINKACGVEFPRMAMPEQTEEHRRKTAAVKRRGERRDAVMLTYQGRTQHLSGWARELGIPVGTLWGRLYRHGMDVEEAFTRKPHARRVTGAEAVQRGRT